MGLLSKLTGGVDSKLLSTGRLGRGIIVTVTPTGSTIQTGNGFVERICVFTLEIHLDETPPFNATVRQRVPEIRLSEIQPGNTTVSVRVDPTNAANVAIDFATPPPTIRTAAASGNNSAAYILANGTVCEVVIVESQPLGRTNADGIDLYAFMLTVFVPHKVPYQARLGNPVPPTAVALLFPGSRLPARVSADEPNAIAIDWTAALAAFQ
jgi:hypothetical protein